MSLGSLDKGTKSIYEGFTLMTYSPKGPSSPEHLLPDSRVYKNSFVSNRNAENH